jgi:hypothetical protein
MTLFEEFYREIPARRAPRVGDRFKLTAWAAPPGTYGWWAGAEGVVTEIWFEPLAMPVGRIEGGPEQYLNREEIEYIEEEEEI